MRIRAAVSPRASRFCNTYRATEPDAWSTDAGLQAFSACSRFPAFCLLDFASWSRTRVLVLQFAWVLRVDKFERFYSKHANRDAKHLLHSRVESWPHYGPRAMNEGSLIEERISPFLAHPCPHTLVRIQRALSQDIKLMSYIQESSSSSSFVVRGTKGDLYTVKISNRPSCNCPDNQYRNDHHCKHILFVFLRVLRLTRDCSLIWQRALLTSELCEILEAQNERLEAQGVASDADAAQNSSSPDIDDGLVPQTPPGAATPTEAPHTPNRDTRLQVPTPSPLAHGLLSAASIPSGTPAARPQGKARRRLPDWMIGETSADKAAAPAKAVRIPKRKAPSTADARLDHTDGTPAKKASGCFCDRPDHVSRTGTSIPSTRMIAEESDSDMEKSAAPVSAKMEAFLRAKPCKPVAQRKAELGIPVD